MKLEDLKMYLVRNSDGQYYRRVGRDGYWSCWTDDLSKASIWTKIGVARSRVTYFANSYPKYPAPDLIEISAGIITVLDEKERIAKAKAAKQRAESKHTLYVLQSQYEEAKRQLDQARKRMVEAEIASQMKKANSNLS